jgi:hypothetical protein
LCIHIDFDSSRYNREIKIAGLVYLHSMNNTRMRGSANLGHELFSRICGPVALRRVVMASTQWETLAYRPAVGPIREKDLKKFWAESINKGAVYKSIHAPGDIVEVIDHILKEHMVATQIQEELVKLGKRVAETEAAQKLKEILESWVADPKAEELPEDKKEELKELKFPDKDGILDRVKRLIRLRSNREPPWYVLLSSFGPFSLTSRLSHQCASRLRLEFLSLLVFCRKCHQPS